MSVTPSGNGVLRVRSLRWMASLWEGAITRDREEERKEEVLGVFRELARDSKCKGRVREYSPWGPRWWS